MKSCDVFSPHKQVHTYAQAHTHCAAQRRWKASLNPCSLFFCLAELWQLTSLAMLPTSFCAPSPCVAAHALLIGPLMVNNYISLSNTESMVLCFSITSLKDGPFCMVRATQIRHSTLQLQPIKFNLRQKQNSAIRMNVAFTPFPDLFCSIMLRS